MSGIDLQPTSGGKREQSSATQSGDSLVIYVDEWPVQIEEGGDWSPLIAFYGLSPEDFEVDDRVPVKISKWQQSKGNDDGTRDVIWLYSYRVAFKRIAVDLHDLAEENDRVKRALRWKARKTVGVPHGDEVAYFHQQGDEQTGKKAGGSIEGMVEREYECLQRSVDRLAYDLKRGRNVTAILDIANGDRVENIAGHYASQPRTTATLRRQMSTAVDMDLARTEAFAAFDLPVHKVYCKSNHGEMRPGMGLSPVTSESDNLDLIVAEMVQRVTDQIWSADQITWHIPHDEDWATFEVAGVTVGVSHGHKVKGSGPAAVGKWVLGQRDMLLFHEGVRMRIAFLGHRHHWYSESISGTSIIQTPSLDGGSQYFTSQSGTLDPHGVVTGYVGASEGPLGWSAVSVL